MANRGWRRDSASDRDSGGAGLWRPEEGETSKDEVVRPTGSAGIWRPEEGSIGLDPAAGPGRSFDPWAESTREAPAQTLPDDLSGLEARPADGSVPDDPGPSRRQRRQSRRLLPWVAITLLLLALIAIGVDGTLVASGIRDDLAAVRSDLASARTLIERGDIAAAHERVDSALERSAHASDLTTRPSFVAADTIPLVEVEAGAIDALTEAAHEAAAGAAAGVNALQSLDFGSDGVAGSFYRDGKLNLEAFLDAEPHLTRAENHLAAATSALDAAPRPRLQPVQDALAAAGDQVGNAFNSVVTGRQLMGLLPQLLGGEGQRRYLLAFQALGEARGTGGLIGTYGVLSADEGEMELEHIGPYTELIPTPKVEGPKWFEKAYGPFAALRQPQQVNLTPHFPTAAEVFLRMYEAKTGVLDLDGVLGLDPVAFGNLLEGTGPIIAEGLDEEVTSENAAEVLLYDSYAEFPDNDSQNRFIERLIQKFWSNLESGDLDEIAFANAIEEATRTGHLKVYSRFDEDQQRLVALDAAGDFTVAGPNVQLVFVNNYGANKLDYFLKREIDTRIQISSGGTVEVTTDIILKNETPADVAPVLKGPSARTTNTMQLAVMMPQGARVVAWEVDGKEGGAFKYSDSGYPVVWDILRIEAGADSRVRLTYEIRDQIGNDSFMFALFPQTAAESARYSLKVLPPKDEGVEGEGKRGFAEVTRAGVFDDTQQVRLRFVEPDS